jgi:hypothetical protein
MMAARFAFTLNDNKIGSDPMKESDIMHESPDHRYWVARQVSKDARIAPVGSIYYQIFKTGLTHSVSTTFVTANLARAISTCDNMARVDSASYRKHERAVERVERDARRDVNN